jgi:hypothetical protein
MPERLRLWLVLGIFAALSVGHAVRVPMFEGPDEPSNLEYLRFIDTEGRLARPTTDVTGELEALERGILPPLWFLVTLPVYRELGAGEWTATPIRNPEFLRDTRSLSKAAAEGLSTEDILAAPRSRMQFLHGRDELAPRSDAVGDLIGLRLIAIPWAVLALLFSYLAIGRALGSRSRALGYTAFLAWTPQLQFISANINMDAMLAAMGALFFFAAVEWQHAQDDRRRLFFAALAGLAVGLAAEVKLNGLVLALPLAFAALPSLRARRWREPLAAGLTLALSLAPFYLWGLVESGHPLWLWHYQTISPLHHPVGQAPAVWNLEGIWNYHLVLFLTWFADFGWTSIWFERWISYPMMALFALGAAVGCWRLFRVRGESRFGLWLFFFGSGLILVAELWFNLNFSQAQGRHLYPFLTVVAFPVAFGLERLRLLWPASLALLALSLFAFPELVGRLRPEGWNEAGWVAVTDQGRAPLLDAPGALAWAPGVVESSGPALAWETHPGHTYELLLTVDNPSFTDRPWAVDGLLLRSSVAFAMPLEGAAAVPADFWDALAPGAVLRFQVLELDLEGHLTARTPVLTRAR